jgi:multiple sugar transport system ATP-binding protein
VPANSVAVAGQTLELALDPGKVMIFDPRTGENLSLEADTR